MQAELRENELKQENKLAIDGEKEIKGGVNTGELNKYKLLIQQKMLKYVHLMLALLLVKMAQHIKFLKISE